jgi:hypothetical protein
MFRYLFKLKLSKNVKRHIGSLFRQSGWTDAGQGWEGKDGELQLAGWQGKRRVVVLRRALPVGRPGCRARLQLVEPVCAPGSSRCSA